MFISPVHTIWQLTRDTHQHLTTARCSGVSQGNFFALGTLCDILWFAAVKRCRWAAHQTCHIVYPGNQAEIAEDLLPVDVELSGLILSCFAMLKALGCLHAPQAFWQLTNIQSVLTSHCPSEASISHSKFPKRFWHDARKGSVGMWVKQGHKIKTMTSACLHGFRHRLSSKALKYF